MNRPSAKVKKTFLLLILAFFGGTIAQSQNLTIPQIMAEPSIAGMRVEGEKLSPDGSMVVYLWNAEGKMPRDLYLTSTAKADGKVILRVSDLPKPSATPTPESKLNYGLTVRDEFFKSRENQLGGFEWSPDSKKLLFSQGGDLYVLNIYGSLDSDLLKNRLQYLKLAVNRRAELIPKIIESLQMGAVWERELFSVANKAKTDWSDLTMKGSNLSEGEILESLMQLTSAVENLLNLDSNYPILRQDKRFLEHKLENNGVENRINVAKLDLNNLSDLGSLRIKRYTKTQAAEFGARFLDNDRIIYQQSGNLFVLNTANATTIQLTKEANPTAFTTVGGGTANKAGTMIAYTVSDSSKLKTLFVPNYLDEFVTTPSSRRGWSEQKLFVTPADGSRDTPFEIKLPKPEGVSGFRRMVWAADNRSLIVDRVDKDTKRRQLFYIHNAGSKDEQIITISDETDDKWQAPLSAIFEPNPKDTSQLFFCSEKDGYNHIYLATIEKAETRPVGSVSDEDNRVQEGGETLTKNVNITQLTKGNWQVEWAKWAPTGQHLVYLSTKGGTTGRQFDGIDLQPDKQRSGFSFNFTDLPDRKRYSGLIANPQFEQNRLLFAYSEWNMPEELFWTTRLGYGGFKTDEGYGGGVSVKLTQTVPANFAKRKWNEPKFIDIPSRDGKQIKSKIYLPAGHNSKKKYPMAIFVHGAGYLQNTINGWNNYYREFMFNQILTQKGYVVLDIDYRGSAGYGRDWRTDVYDFLGGKDMDDHVDAIDFMVKNYSVDQKRVGVYGGSYGGFMAGMLAMRAPDKIAAAAALRPVFDWKNYYYSSPQYTAQRLGFPDKNPEAYKRSSPITYADKLERPLLILHGMVDDNVPVQDSQQMIEKLIRLRKTKYFESMLYPSENHGFIRPESWTDEYERILAFFEKNLK